MALDEVLLGEQRLGLGLGGDELDLGDLADHVDRPARAGLGEVPGHPLADRLRLADVEDLAASRPGTGRRRGRPAAPGAAPSGGPGGSRSRLRPPLSRIGRGSGAAGVLRPAGARPTRPRRRASPSPRPRPSSSGRSGASRRRPRRPRCPRRSPGCGSGRHRRREADLVPAVVDAQLEAGRLEQPGAEAVDHRQRQVAVGDGGAERALGLGALDVDVDPLVVAARARRRCRCRPG